VSVSRHFTWTGFLTGEVSSSLAQH